MSWFESSWRWSSAARRRVSSGLGKRECKFYRRRLLDPMGNIPPAEEGSMPASARRSVYLIETYWLPRTL